MTMPCQDCAGLHVELLTLKEFMAQWFNILMKKIEVVEKQNTALCERLDLSNVSDKLSDQSADCHVVSSALNAKSPSLHNGGCKSPMPGNNLKIKKRSAGTRNGPTSTAVTSSTSSTSLNDRINFLMIRAAQQAQSNGGSPVNTGIESALETDGADGDGSGQDGAQHDPMRLFPSMAFTTEGTEAGSDPAVDENDCSNGGGNIGDNGELHLNDMSDVKMSLSIADMVNEANGSGNGDGDSQMFDSPPPSYDDEESEEKETKGNVAIISGPGKFTCRLCRSHFTQMSNLRRHVRVIHQGLTKHACRYCGKVFAWKGAWRRHEQFVHELRNVGATTGGAAAPAANADAVA